MASGDGLSFDRADVPDPGRTGLVCQSCQTPLRESYFEVLSQVVCPACRDRLAPAVPPGSGIGRFARASCLGALAALTGSAVYGTIMALTGIEAAIVTIFIGVGVGHAVRKGSHSVGGWLYQLLAVALTYLSLMLAYVPSLFQIAWKEQPVAERGLGVAIVFLLLAVAVSFAVPFMSGIKSILSLVIIGIGLWEAWKINRVVRPEVRGPYDASASTPVPLPVPALSLAKTS